MKKNIKKATIAPQIRKQVVKSIKDMITTLQPTLNKTIETQKHFEREYSSIELIALSILAVVVATIIFCNKYTDARLVQIGLIQISAVVVSVYFRADATAVVLRHFVNIYARTSKHQKNLLKWLNNFRVAKTKAQIKTSTDQLKILRDESAETAKLSKGVAMKITFATLFAISQLALLAAFVLFFYVIYLTWVSWDTIPQR